MAARRLSGTLIALVLSAATQAAPPPTTVELLTPPQPQWSQLTSSQKDVLHPLASSWDSMDNLRRRKWIGIAARFQTLPILEQKRVQERMQEWAALSPSERAKARDTYRDLRQLPIDQRQTVKQKWEAYSNLPHDEQQRLRTSGSSGMLLPPRP